MKTNYKFFFLNYLVLLFLSQMIIYSSFVHSILLLFFSLSIVVLEAEDVVIGVVTGVERGVIRMVVI